MGREAGLGYAGSRTTQNAVAEDALTGGKGNRSSAPTPHSSNPNFVGAPPRRDSELESNCPGHDALWDGK